MKRIGLLFGLGVAGLLAAQAAPVLAADDEKTTNFSFSIDKGTLALVQTPADISFGKVVPAELATKGTSLSASTLPTPVDVADYRGSGEGWTLDLKYSEISTSDAKNTLTEPKLQLIINQTPQANLVTPVNGATKNGITESTPALTTAIKEELVPAQQYKVAGTYDELTGQGLNQYTFSAVNLTLPPQNTFVATSYSGTIDWTLTAGSDGAASETE